MSAPWLAEPSPDLAGVPTMISLEERQYLRWLTSAAWRDAGHVVEIGPWLGGSTLCLAQGARARCERVRHRIHAVDNFVWRPFMAEHAPLDLCAGDSFVAQFRAHVAPFSDLVAVHAASLPDEEIPGDPEARSQRDHGERPAFRWDAREPVEILFVDGAKSWRGMRHLLAAVGPSLATGALLVCQDFKYWGCYWVPMILGRLAERLELAHDLAAGDTVAFHVRLPIGEREIAGLPDDVHAADPCEAFEALERMRAVLRRAGDELGAHALALSRVKFLAHRGDLDGACREFERVQAAWPALARAGQLERARRYLEESRGRRVAPRRGRALADGARPLVALARSLSSRRAIRPKRSAEEA